jgi:hypothetical protein
MPAQRLGRVEVDEAGEVDGPLGIDLAMQDRVQRQDEYALQRGGPLRQPQGRLEHAGQGQQRLGVGAQLVRGRGGDETGEPVGLELQRGVEWQRGNTRQLGRCGTRSRGHHATIFRPGRPSRG